MLTVRRISTTLVLIVGVTLLLGNLAFADESSGRQLRGPCTASIIGNLHALSGNDEEPFTEGMIFEKAPAEVLRLTTERHAPSSAVIMAIPLRDDEYQAVFGTSSDQISHADNRELESAARLAKQAALKTTHGILNRAQFQSYLKHEHSQFIIIAGHNELGKFSFIGGEKVELPLLGEDCARAGKTCVFVSCRSRDHLRDGSVGVSRELTLPEGVWITQKIDAWLRRQAPADVSLAALVAYVRKLDYEANVRFHASYFVIGACATAGTGAAAYALVEGMDKK
ncbi:hypothetical protein ACX83E_00100 [Burkholderia pseudomallei]